MTNLLRAGFRRARKSVLIWLGFAVSILSGIVTALNVRIQGYLDDVYIIPLFIVLAIVISLMIGTDHSDGITRNEIICGHSKGSIYLSQLILYLTFTLIAASLFLGSFSVFVIGYTTAFPTEALVLSVLGFLLLSMTYTVLLVTISLLITRKAINVVICFLLVLTTIFSAYMIHGALHQPEHIYTIIVDGTGMDTYIEEKNPHYIDGTPKIILEQIEMIIPYGSLICDIAIVYPCFNPHMDPITALPAEEITQLEIMPLYSLAVSVLTGALGWFYFRKKELK